MHEIYRVTLENEMDLILAHKRSMKLGELAGISLSAQTTFATAVSELARWALDKNEKGCLVLYVDNSMRVNYLVASINDSAPEDNNGRQYGLEYAKRLVSKYQITKRGEDTTIDLFYSLPGSVRVEYNRIDEWRILFRNEKPVSPYDELKRKNEQLQELSDRIQKSEQQYRTLTNTLPQLIFSLDISGKITYVNEWLEIFTGKTIEELSPQEWRNLVHPNDYNAFSILFSDKLSASAFPIKIQCRLKHSLSDTYLWHLVSVTPQKNEKQEITSWIGYMVDIHAEKVVEQTLKDNIELKKAQESLEQKQKELEETILQLNRSNYELQQFNYIASHDLQEPVRKVLYYCDYILTKYAAPMDKEGLRYLKNIEASTLRMRTLILDLLRFSQVSSKHLNLDNVSLEAVANSAVQSLQLLLEQKKGTVHVGQLPDIIGEKSLIEQLFENIINNAIKYSRPDVPPEISIYSRQDNGNIEIIFEDNGIGFEEQYVHKMFELFQRLHTRQEYDGNGIGLAICKKIMEHHQGSITAIPGAAYGAKFILSFPASTK